MSFVKKSTHLQRYTTEGHPDLGRKMLMMVVSLSLQKKCEALLDKHGKPEDEDKNIMPFIYGVHCRPCEIMWMWMCHKAKNRRTNLMPLSQQSSNVACRTLSSSLWLLGTEKPIHAHGPKIGYDWIMLGISPAIFWNTWVPYCQCRAHMLYTYICIYIIIHMNLWILWTHSVRHVPTCFFHLFWFSPCFHCPGCRFGPAPLAGPARKDPQVFSASRCRCSHDGGRWLLCLPSI